MSDNVGVGVHDQETLETAADDEGGFLSGLRPASGLLPGSGSPEDRKTVSFGDAAAVRSLPLWSLIALIVLAALWWAGTRAWGFPDDFRAATAAAYEQKDPPETLTDAKLLTECRLAGIAATEAGEPAPCNEDAYSQFLSPAAFPTPADTWRGFNTLRTEGFKNITLWEHARTSLTRVGVGMLVGSLVGIPIGFAMGLSSRIRGFFDTPVELLRPIPPLALIPLFILWFGIGNPSAFALLIFASVWIMIISARAGVRDISLSKVRAAYSLGASKRQILFRLIVPNALPELFTGFRVALGVSWGTLVAAELVGTDTGLGSMIFQARNFFRLDVVVVGIIVISIIGVLLDLIVRMLESVLIPWRGKGR